MSRAMSREAEAGPTRERIPWRGGYRRMNRWLSALLVVLTAASSPTWIGSASAAVLCQKRSGAVVVRDACKKKETPLDLSQFGAAGPKRQTRHSQRPNICSPPPATSVIVIVLLRATPVEDSTRNRSAPLSRTRSRQ